MGIGQVNSDCEAIITAEVHGSAEQKENFAALLDTGFTEHLTLSRESISRLGLRHVHTAQVVLGDGSEVQFLFTAPKCYGMDNGV